LRVARVSIQIFWHSALLALCIINFLPIQTSLVDASLVAKYNHSTHHADPTAAAKAEAAAATAAAALAKQAALSAAAARNTAAAVTPANNNLAFGISGGMASLSPAAQASELAGIKATGVGWVRYDIDWNNIEQSPGQYNWGPYDQEVQDIAAHGLRSLAIIDYTPPWARQSQCSGSKFCAPADPNAYADFAAAVASRYQGYGLSDYEIWNEPNNVNFYQPAANPTAYTAMLQATYSRIKQVEPRAIVITGGTAPEDSSNGYLSPTDFIQGIYAAGARGYFDAVAAHPYTWPYSPAWPNPDGAWGQMTTMHNIMAANGDGGKKIWITEYGAPTGGPGSVALSGFSTAEGGADHVTEALQARIVSDSISIESQVSWIGPFFWYSYIDAGTSPSTVENFFGLLRADGSRKPAYATFVQMVATH
jgi:hypothetical protein